MAASAACLTVGPLARAGVLQVRTQMRCVAGASQSSSYGNVMHGRLRLQSAQDPARSRELRVYAVQGRNFTEVETGEDQVAGPIVWSAHPRCALQESREEVPSRALASAPVLDSLAAAHSPLLMLSADQERSPESDVPLALAYAWVGNTLRYTLFLSDENSMPTAKDTEKQMARYGRRSDIEWIYEVEFDANGKVIARRYQGGILFGMGHRTYTFRGAFVEGTEHPILYDVATHHVFSDKPRFWATSRKPVGVSLVAREEIKTPESREAFLFRHGWINDVTDREVVAEGKSAGLTSEDYLYVFMDGELRRGSFRWHFMGNFSAGERHVSSRGTIDRLGEGLWGKQAYSALPLGKAELSQIALGVTKAGAKPSFTLRLEKASSTMDLLARQVTLYRFVRDESGELRFQPLPLRLDCESRGRGMICEAAAL